MKRFCLGLVLAFILSLCCSALAGLTVHHRGDEEKKRIAITVDDCYSIGRLQKMLALFEQEQIHVTFYPVGGAIKEKDGEVWRQILEQGHEIGNHTNGHNKLTDCDTKTVRSELKLMKKNLNAALGYEYPILTMRPPFGSFTGNQTISKISNAGYEHLVMWSVNQQEPSEAIKEIKNGSICLFHTNERDLDCLTEIIPVLKESGFEMVTISALLDITQEEEGVEN